MFKQLLQLVFGCGHTVELQERKVPESGVPPQCPTCGERRIDRVLGDQVRIRGLERKESR